jgi:hypothetical protein
VSFPRSGEVGLRGSRDVDMSDSELLMLDAVRILPSTVDDADSAPTVSRLSAVSGGPVGKDAGGSRRPFCRFTEGIPQGAQEYLLDPLGLTAVSRPCAPHPRSWPERPVA